MRKDVTDMKTRSAVRGWLGLMALGAVLLAPQALAESASCERTCGQKTGGQILACTRECPKPGKATSNATNQNRECLERCSQKLERAQHKCVHACTTRQKRK